MCYSFCELITTKVQVLATSSSMGIEKNTIFFFAGILIFVPIYKLGKLPQHAHLKCLVSRKLPSSVDQFSELTVPAHQLRETL